MTAKTKALTLVLSVYLSVFALGEDRSSNAFRPDLTVDLRQFGYDYIKDGRLRVGYYWLRNRVVLLDSETLAVSFFIENRNAAAATSPSRSSGDYRFETVFLDARSGQSLRAQEWSNASFDSGLFPVPGGRFVIWHGLDLTLYASDGHTIKSSTIDPRLSHLLEVRQSPSGNTLIASSLDRLGEHLLCLSSTDLREIARFDLHGAKRSGSDSYVVAVQSAQAQETRYVKPIGPTEVVAYGPITGDVRTRKLITVYKTNDRLFSPVIGFLDDHTLAFSGGDRLEIMSLSGGVLYVYKADRGQVRGITPCRDCDLVAFVTTIAKGGLSLLDDTIYKPAKVREVKIVILNRSTRNVVELPSAGSTTTNPGGVEPGLALAPDGCTLAHQADWRVEIYHICGSELGRQLGFEPGSE